MRWPGLRVNGSVPSGAMSFAWSAEGAVGLDREDVDVEHVVLQELGYALHLLIEVVVLRDEGIGCCPAMRRELSVLWRRSPGSEVSCSFCMWQVWQVETTGFL